MTQREYKLVVNTDERLGAIGMTGYGKSFLMLRFCNQLARCIIIDTKHEIRVPDFKIVRKPEAVFSRLGSPERVIFRPPRSRIKDDFFGQVWSKFGKPGKANVVVYIDEAANVTSEHKIGDELKNCVQAGRSVGIGIWWSAQNSTRINNTLLSLTDKMAIFRMNVESDRRKLGGTVGQKVAEAAGYLERRQFLTYGWSEVEGLESEGFLDVTVLELTDTEQIIRSPTEVATQETVRGDELIAVRRS